MFIVPRVTMNDGRRTMVTSSPFASPKATVTARPHRIARYSFMPLATASLVMTMLPSAIIIPHERSMPAVRMISVWPIAMTPTTITCCRMSEKFCSDRKRSDCVVKKAHASTRASSGATTVPSATRGNRNAGNFIRCSGCADASSVVGGERHAASIFISPPRWGEVREGPALLLVAPAQIETHLRVLDVDTGDRFVADQGHAGVGISGHLL